MILLTCSLIPLLDQSLQLIDYTNVISGDKEDTDCYLELNSTKSHKLTQDIICSAHLLKDK
jgi:hypothetical protein